MPVALEDIRNSPIDTSLCEQVEQEFLDILNSRQLNLREVIHVIAHLLIDTGGSLEGLQCKLSCEDMWRRYALEPRLGNALMANGADMLHEWLKLRENGEEE